ncbi:unnamed protein product [Gongylonema pulchrum]|uniref:Transcription initiation factor TFIID subunit 6 n=1 Tax=Gongylonema pulchrum TaxID=637853 RepID=A0A183DLJ8_9BILA|nr:unnamed protein product [Gongylonema pulchrum]
MFHFLDVEYVNHTQVLEQAKKFAVHSRRRRVTAADFDSAVALEGYPPLFGFSANDELPFRFAGSMGRDLFVADERDLEITPIVNAPAVKLPYDINIKGRSLFDSFDFFRCYFH